MSAHQIVEDMLVALDDDDIEKVAGYLDNNLKLQVGPFQAGKDEFLKVLYAMGSMQPPVQWLLIRIKPRGEEVSVTFEPAGENTGTLLKPGMKLRSSSESLTSSERSEWIFIASGEKISSVNIHPTPDSLLSGLLSTLGLN